MQDSGLRTQDLPLTQSDRKTNAIVKIKLPIASATSRYGKS